MSGPPRWPIRTRALRTICIRRAPRENTQAGDVRRVYSQGGVGALLGGWAAATPGPWGEGRKGCRHPAAGAVGRAEGPCLPPRFSLTSRRSPPRPNTTRRWRAPSTPAGLAGPERGGDRRLVGLEDRGDRGDSEDRARAGPAPRPAEPATAPRGRGRGAPPTGTVFLSHFS